MKMFELLEAFFEKFKMSGYNFNNYILEDYMFLFNGSLIPLKEQKTLIDYGLILPVNKIFFHRKNEIIG